MSRRTPHELLTELRIYLQHFEKTGDIGEGASVAEIQQRLRVRIAETEAVLQRSASRSDPNERP
jgi:hypothetical protein